MSEFSTTVARETFAELLGRVAYGKERVVITRSGKRQVAVIPVEDLERLEALEKESGIAAFERLQENAVKRGLNKLSAKEIESEIRSSRADRRKQRRR